MDSDKFKDLMDLESGDDGDESGEEISETFICCVCRDLLYKPIVLGCGHISCFWCVHKSMSGLQKSCCPICRNQYYHFPSVCQTLHFLLLKMYPTTYKKRENQILEEEKSMDCFSPQLSEPAYQLQPDKTVVQPSKTRRIEQVETVPDNQVIGLSNFGGPKEDIAATSVSMGEDGNLNQINYAGTCQQVSVDDVLCGSCKSMLFRPIVLNCGHVFCMCCVVPRANEILMCEVCQSPHPSDIPKVCLEFEHFLEEQFPKEYGLRRSSLQMKQEQFSCDTTNTCTSGSSEAAKKKFHFSFSSGDDPSPWWSPSSKVHIGVGCDSCGMYPITGDRYRCKDCVEKIGYDLCKDCYTTRSKLPGRFSQQHTSDHKFEIEKPSSMHNIMLRLLRGQLQEGSAVSDALHVGAANLNPPLSNDTNEESENVVDPPSPSSETEPNQSENQRSP